MSTERATLMVECLEVAEAETTFARYLRQWMVTSGISQREAARLLGVSHTQLGRYFTGSWPKLPVASRLADALGVSLDEFLAEGDEGAPASTETVPPPVDPPRRRASDVDAPALLRQIEDDLAALRRLLGDREPEGRVRSG